MSEREATFQEFAEKVKTNYADFRQQFGSNISAGWFKTPEGQAQLIAMYQSSKFRFLFPECFAVKESE